jgi:AAA+ superfamily predicted ATPase
MSILDNIFKFQYQLSKEFQEVSTLTQTTLPTQKKIAKYFLKANYPEIRGNTLFFYCTILSISLEENCIDNMTVASALNINRNDLVKLRYELIVNELVEKGYIEKRNSSYSRRSERREVMVSPEIYEAILLDKELKKNEITVDDLYGLTITAKNYLDEIENGKVTLSFAVLKLKELSNRIDSPFTKFIKNYEIGEAEFLVLMICVWDFLNEPNDHKVSVNRILDSVFDKKNASQLFRMKQSYMFGFNQLFDKKLIQKVDREEMVSNNSIKLHDRVVEIIETDPSITIQQKTFKELTQIEEKDIPKLFYNTKVDAEFQKMKSLLEPEKFKLVLNNFEQAQLPSHANILLYGESGTGKTEMARALSVGKMVYNIDVSEWKSMYYGRSQQIVKEHFKKFSKMCFAYPNQCVMVLNEADSLLGKRNTANSATDETSNAIQSILLESIENLPNGSLLIATTNMNNLLDDAFSRRFLFKIHVDLPNYETSFQIWKHYLAGYSDDLYSKLGRLGLSGGFISNIAKKVAIDKIILGDEVTENTILEWAVQESNYSKKLSSPMGFQKAG